MTSAAGENITNLLHKSLCCCLNEDLRAPHTNLFVGDHTLPLRSDADEQLLLQLGFNQTMKLSSIVLGVPDNSSCPKTIKLFCNQGNLGFDDAAEMKAVQIVDVPIGTDAKTITINLQANKWNRTDLVTIFVADNHGEDYSEIHSLKIFGDPIMGTDVAAIKDVGKQG